jgi:hypothetical protein
MIDTESGFRENGVSVSLPAHIYMAKCVSFEVAMQECITPQDELHELVTISQDLTRLLQVQHRRDIVLRDINMRNVVKANLGMRSTWTLLEYCNARRSGFVSDVLSARSMPPEVRFATHGSCHVLAIFARGVPCSGCSHASRSATTCMHRVGQQLGTCVPWCA